MNKHTCRKALALILALSMIFALSACGGGEVNLDKSIEKTSEYVYGEVMAPTIGHINGDWAVKGIADSGLEVEEGYFESYYDNVRAILKAKKGILDEEHFTEYARVIIGLNSINKDALDVEGYNLVTLMDNYEILAEQGVNAAAYALIGSNLAGQKLKCEDKLIDFIIASMETGNYGEKGVDEYGVDYIAMAIEGLSFYQDQERVKKYTESAINAISEKQKDDGSFGNCESTSEVIYALTQNGIDVTTDERFIKDGKTPLDGLMVYADKDGGFYHVLSDKEPNEMATERALVALNAIKLSQNNKKIFM